MFKMWAGKGEVLYKLYRALTYGLSPLVHLHLRWRKFRGLEHVQRWPERLGRPSLPRPVGHLIWFHAVSLGEGIAAIPVIKCCLDRRPDVTILLTSTTISAFEVIKNRLPDNVLYQFAPVDTPAAVETFLGYWKPNAILLIESELWPNLIMSAARNGIALALLNARMSTKSFKRWSLPVVLHLPSLLLSKFALIAPLSNTQAINFQLLQAPPLVINFSGDLKYIIEGANSYEEENSSLQELQNQLMRRKVWLASSLHKGEEKIMIRVHEVLKEIHPDLVTIIASRHPHHGRDIALELKKKGIGIAVRSQHEELLPGIDIYIVDTLDWIFHLFSAPRRSLKQKKRKESKKEKVPLGVETDRIDLLSFGWFLCY
ncbi:hypothetical protein M9H77_24185 [Catharanthus roseus]|uniref:Uncharacterized protein n=1 Tax=Catharanthus roseus TaxID=4058 RepID=A0ACC0AY06_CATRO|nr:hypothetical protein M9H77_24185 [Catharanthus roseus]